MPQLQIYLCSVKNKAPDEISPALLAYLQGFLMDERKARFERALSERTRYITCVLENVIDAHNVNAVIRSCECFGIQDVHIIEEETAFKPAKNVLKGAHKWLSLYRYNDPETATKRCLDGLRKRGYKIIASAPAGDHQSLHDLDINAPMAVVFGKENVGISNLVKQEADAFVAIPMYGFTGSLNISVAAAIVLQDLGNRLRQSDGIDWQLKKEEKDELRTSWTLKNLYRNELLIERFFQDRCKT